MLLFCEVSNPRDLWDKHWKDLSDDILFRQQQRFGNINRTLTDNQIQNYALCELETALNINHITLAEFPDLHFPDITLLQQAINESYEEEMGNTETGLEEEAAILEGGLNTEQRNVYQTILSAAYQNEGKLYFVYGSGGTGKTYLWRSIISRLQCQRELVIAIASSGIAALLLPNGRTAHSRFHIPINLNERSTCFVSQGSRTAMMIRRARLIIWDEAPMVHRHAFEAMDRTFRDIMQNDVLFGGKTVVLGGDFRQILPVVPRKGREDVITATITKSRTIWPACTIFRLTTNMRLRQHADRQESQALQEFSKWILDLGESKLPTKSKEGEDEPMWIKMPSDLVIDDTGDKKASIVHEIYPDLISKYGNLDYLAERAILTPRNEWVDEINNHILSMLPGEEHVYKSADRVCPLANKSTADDTLYPPEYLNTLEFAGIPNHEIRLKVGSPIILLRNIMQRKGLCNGTRLIVSRLDTRVIQAKVVTGTNIGEKVPISRVEMTPTDSNLPFTLKRRQFPIRVCFAMTINKSQGQTFNRVGLYLHHPVFSHGQLYVAVSRVTCRSGIRMSIGQDGDTPEDNTLTKNVVYKEIFADL